jgi:hypothetical protein
MKTNKISIALLASFLAFGMSSCLSDGEDTITLGSNNKMVADIPSDDDADPNPEIGGDHTTNIPNIQYSVVDEEGYAVCRIDMTGVQGENSADWLRLLGTNEPGQNVWVEVDGKPKGIKVYNTADNEGQRVLPVDLVFLVDNSGSMSEEADVIARDITSWAQKLAQSTLDIRFGCVGYDGAITGAADLTTYHDLASYLDRSTGTDRTVGFLDSRLSTLTSSYRTGGNSSNECGMAALRFASDNFSFRKGANRIYVNFTDEPNQPAGIARFSVESLKTDWNTSLGTIHTVFSDGRESSREFNYLMSQYTGGTVINTNRSFSGVTLESLPITGALQNSYVIRFSDIDDLIDGQPHEVKITILSPDGKVRAERIFYIVFTRG